MYIYSIFNVSIVRLMILIYKLSYPKSGDAIASKNKIRVLLECADLEFLIAQ